MPSSDWTPTDQAALDRALIDADGTPNKGRLGANAILGVSLATAKAAAAEAGVPLYRHLGGEGARTLPVPMLNVINGGAHAQNSIDLQEFMLVPAGAERFSEAVRIGSEVYHALKAVLHERGLATAVGDEGGFAPDLPSSEAAIEVILEAAGRAGHSDAVAIALDPATSEVYRDGAYRFEGKVLDGPALCRVLGRSLGSLPDRLDRGSGRRGRLGDLEAPDRVSSASALQLVGDDLFVTNPERLARGIAEGAGNSILIKVNQIGTLTETLEAIRLAHDAGFTTVISHRSGETEDTTIADLAVATGVRPAQDRGARPVGPRREVQPPAPDRGGARRGSRISRLGRVPAVLALSLGPAPLRWAA